VAGTGDALHRLDGRAAENLAGAVGEIYCKKDNIADNIEDVITNILKNFG
jgi:hypothetical protein